MPNSNAWVESLGWMLIHSVWLISVIVGVSTVGLGLLRQRSANARYLFGCVALLLSLSTLPAVLVWGLTRSVTPEEFETLVSTRSLTVRDGEAVDLDGSGKTIGIDAETELHGEPVQIEINTRRNSDGRLRMEVDVPRPAEARAMSPVELTAWEQAESWLRPHLALLVSGWLAGVVLLSVRPLIGWHSARRLQRVGLSEVSDSLKEMLSRLAERLGLKHAVRLFQSSLVQIPCVVGAFKPVILLPASAIIGLSPDQLEALLAHELAHIRRHDFAVNVVQTLVETLLFYHPAIWWLSHRVRQEREHCCDDLAISVCGDVAGYARMLVSVEGLRGRVPQSSVAASGGSLVERIRRLLPAPHEQPRSPWLPGIIVLGTLVVFTFGSGVGSPTPDAPNEKQNDKKPKSEITNPTNNANGDLRSNPAAGSGDPRTAQQLILTFPRDRSVGEVETRLVRENGWSVLGRYGDWSSSIPAIGEVRIPAGHEVALTVRDETDRSFEWLDQLPADAIRKLNLSYRKISEEGLRRVGRLTGLRELTFEGVRLTDAGVQHLVTLTELRHLNLNGHRISRDESRVSDESLRVLLQMRLLESLDLRGTAVTDSGMPYLARLTSLQDLTLSGTRVSDAGLAALEPLQSLLYLRLGLENFMDQDEADESKHFTDAALPHVAKLKKLQALRLGGCSITDDGLVALREMPELVNLDLNWTKVTGRGLAHLSELPKLKYLSPPPGCDDAGLAQLAKIRTLTGVFSNFEHVTDAGFQELAKIKGLERLSLGSQDMTNAGLRHIGSMPALRELNLEATGPRITVAGLGQFAKQSKIEMLALRGVRLSESGAAAGPIEPEAPLQSLRDFRNLKDLVIAQLIVERGPATELDLPVLAELKSLEHLSVDHRPMSPRTLAYASRMPNLRSFDYGDNLVEDKNVAGLHGFPSLRKLSLPLTRLTDAGLVSLTGFSQLEELTIGGQITDAGLLALKSLSKLKYLEIGSPHVTAKGLSDLQTAMPSLKHARKFGFELPETLDNQLTQAMKRGTPLAERRRVALADARSEYLRALVVFVDGANPRTKSLYSVLKSRDGDLEEFDRPLNDYAQLWVSAATDDERASAQRELQLPVRPLQTPSLVVVDADGMLVASRDVVFDSSGQLDLKSLQEFLIQYMLPSRDAEELLRDALAKAQREDKRVLLQETGIGCYPCRLLSRFLEQHHDIFDEHFVSVKIDSYRWKHGGDVIKRFRLSNGGIPWVAILDATGKKLGSWDEPDGDNIGFPTEPDEIDRIIKLLKATAPRLSDKQIDVLKKALSNKNTRVDRGSPDPALAPTAGLPNSDEDTNQPNNANGDLRSNPAAGSGDPRRAQATTVTRDDTALRLAKSSAQVAKAEYEKMLESNRKVSGSIPQNMIIHFRCQSEIADLQVRLEELRLAEKETREVEVVISRKTVEPLKFNLDLMVESNRKVRGSIPHVEVERARLKYELALLDVEKTERRAKGEDTADLEVQSLRKQQDVAKAEYNQMLESNRKVPGVLPQTELDRSRLVWERIAADLKRAEQKARAGRGSPDSALDSTKGLPNSDNGLKESNAAAGSGDPRRAQASAAELPDGIRIELVGLENTDPKSPAAWKPDGTKLERPEEWPKVLEVRDQNPTHGFVFRITGLAKGQNVTWRLPGQWAWPDLRDKTPEYLSVSTRHPDAKTADARVGIAYAEWGPWQRVELDDTIKEKVEVTAPFRAVYEKVKPHVHASNTDGLLKSGLELEGISGIDDHIEYEAVIVDQGGTRHERRGIGASRNGTIPYFDVAKDRIGHLEYRLRPYKYWVTFENVSLQPGKMTDVKVKVAQPLKPMADAGDPSRAQGQIALMDDVELLASQSGKIVSLRVAAGAKVQKDDVLAVLNNLDGTNRDEIIAPFPGDVLKVYRREGDNVKQSQAILRLVSLDRVIVKSELKLPGRLQQSKLVGAEAEVVPDPDDQNAGTFLGKVTFIDPRADANGNHRISVEVKNRQKDGKWLLVPGQMARLIIRDTVDESKDLDLQLRFAQASAAVAKAEYERMLEANRKVSGAVPQSEIARSLLRLEAAELRLKKAQREASGEQATDLDLPLRRKERDVAEAEYEKMLEANRRVPGAIPEREITRARLRLDAAQLRVWSEEFGASAQPEKPEIMVGEPTWLAFKVTNKSETNRRIIVGGDYRNRLGRPESFSVEVLDADGQKVSQPDAGGTMGGISVTHTLQANGESSEPFELFLPHWATITQPGSYRIAIRRRCELVPDDGSNAFGAKTEKVEVAAETTINVVPADAAKFGELIERLGTKLLGENSEESERASKMLKAMHDERIVPWFVKLLDQPSGQRKLLACDALGQYGSDAAFAALQRAMKTTSAHIGNTTTHALAEESADQVHYSAALALAKCPHPEAAAFLLTQATDRNWSVRIAVLRFAATLNTQAARDVIERLTKDENEDVRNEALRSKPAAGPGDPRRAQLRGTIVWVDRPNGRAWISLGEADMVKKNMQFEVRAKTPADGKVRVPVVKATVEVTRIIDAHASEVRILTEQVGDGLAKEDDVICVGVEPRRPLKTGVDPSRFIPFQKPSGGLRDDKDDSPRDDNSANAGAPGQIRGTLKLDRKEFLLGESIAVEYEMTNDGNDDAPYGKGGFYPDLRINDGFRMSAVKVDENGKPLAEPVGNWRMPENFGGPVGGFKLKSGEKYSTTLFVTRYVRLLEPGRYRLRVENVDRLERDPVSPYSKGETYLTLKQPTPEEARGVFERMKKAPRQAYDENAMKFLPEAADFQAMHQPIYLPILKEFAAKSDRDALQSLQRMEQIDANEVLVATMADALDRDDWRTARVCFQHLKTSLPFPNWFNKPLGEYDQPNRDRVARLWKPAFVPTLTRLAKRLNVEVTSLMQQRKSQPRDADANDREFLKVFRNGYFPPEHPQSLLVDLDFIYRCVGQSEDFADCLTAFAHSIELTKTLPLETNQYFRPRGSASGFGHTVMYMLRRGAKAPNKPAHPGEAAAFAIALRTQDGFRPDGWQAEVMKWLKHDSPYLTELILGYLPDPVPNEVFEYLPTALAHDYIDLQIAACHVAKKHPRPAYREPLQKILDTAKDPYLRKYAVDAARANGLKAKYDPDAPFVDQAAENADPSDIDKR